MKRILSLAAALCLLLTLSVPALAQSPDMEAALTEIAAGVKQTLEIGDDYTEFSGSYNDGLRPGWYMYWSGEEEELSVTCDENGVITEVYRWINNDRRSDFYGFDAHFPSVSRAEAEKTAGYWLEKLMGENERARIDAVSASLTADGSYRFDGTILLNGLESPITFSMCISGSGLMSYDRSDGYAGYVGEVPEAKTGSDKADASAALAEAVAMELYYVTDENGQVRLRYVPVGPYTVVDAMSGESVDMDALYASFGGTASAGRGVWAEETAASANYAAGDYALTEVELSAIAHYGEVLPQEALDAALRELPGLDLDGFELSRCSYAMNGDEITASLRYTAEMTEERLFGFSEAAYADYSAWNDRLTVTKYITMDAKTGALQSLSTSYPLWDETRETVDDGEGAALFLQACAPEKFEESALCTLQSVSAGDGLTFARVHDGYYFPENYLYVAISPEGSVDEFRCVWDEEIEFADSRGIVDEDTALAAYIDALDVTLGYVAWPEDIDWSDPVLLRYSEWGYTFVESLRLAYYYAGTEKNAGVDALTGEAILTPGDGSIVYDDLDGNAGQSMIEALAEAGIGFDGGRFEPERAITQKEAVTLLMQAEGYDVRGWEEDDLRREAVWFGFIEEADWSPEADVTGAELLRMLLGASSYRTAAELTGVWAAEYGDSGYTAIASALGMLPDGMELTEPCTRAEAAALLYGFMTR
ncbi:MAG: YcdB/YcdC domain-containing protein [Oscillospiraceae bacterium]